MFKITIKVSHPLTFLTLFREHQSWNRVVPKFVRMEINSTSNILKFRFESLKVDRMEFNSTIEGVGKNKKE